MSPANTSSVPSSPSDIWAGKSRNARAQAKHRAKRKLYIEQLEQTVSKLQTALALSSDDIINLPSAQMKLRELKEENETLKAEVRKLRSLHYYPYAHTPGVATEYPRSSKRRRSTYAPDPRSFYLESENHSSYPFTPGCLSSSRLVPVVSGTTATDLVNMPTSVAPVMESACTIKDEFSPWSSFESNLQTTAPPGWRARTTSSSSASSDASPLLLASLFPPSTPLPSWPSWPTLEPPY